VVESYSAISVLVAQYIDLYWWTHNSECCKLQFYWLEAFIN